MTTETETKTTKEKRPADLYIFESSTEKGKLGKIAGRVYLHSTGKGFNVLMNGKRYAAFPPKPKTAEAIPAEATPIEPTQGEGA